MKSLNVNLENLTTEERATLTALIDKSQKSTAQNLLKSPFKHYERYLYISAFYGIESSLWVNTKEDNFAYSMDNVYQETTENRTMLEKRIEQQKAIVEVNRRVKMLTQEQYPNWECDWTNCSQNKTYPYYAWANGEVRISCGMTTQAQFMFEYAPEGIYEQIDTNLLKKAMGVE